MLTGRLPAFIGRMRKVDLLMICAWIIKVWEEIPSYIIKGAFLKCCISNNMDGTEANIIWEEEAANDGDSDGDLLYPDSDKELCAVFDEDFLGFCRKASSNPNGPFQGHKSTRNMYDTGMNPFSSFFSEQKKILFIIFKK